MQSSQRLSPPNQLVRQNGAAAGGALVPSRLSSMPIEPPDPDEVEDRLAFRTAAQYKKAVALAERYLNQARLAVERRAVSIDKAERQAVLDHEETVINYRRQIAHAQSRYKSLVEQAHAKHRQTIYQARLAAQEAEEIYKEALQGVPGYGELQLRVLAAFDSRAVSHHLLGAYKGSLGPDGQGDYGAFLANLDKVLDHARERQAVAPLRFVAQLLTGLIAQQAQLPDLDKEEAERRRQAIGARLLTVQGFLDEEPKDATPPEIRAVYLAVGEWLERAAGTPFDLALDRLKLDVEAAARNLQKELKPRIEAAAYQCAQLHEIQPAAEAYRQAQRVLASSELAAKNVLQSEVARIDQALEKEIQMADAMVVGMDHTAARRLSEARQLHRDANRLVKRWSRVLSELEEDIGHFQKAFWRFTEGFDHLRFWQGVRARHRLKA